MRSRAPLPRAVITLLALVGGGCGGGGGGGSTPPPQQRAPYFTVNGKQQFVATRNISGRSVAEIEALLDAARDDGTTLVRFHVTHLGGLGITASGGVDEAWSAAWEQVFAHAEADGIQVMPVFGVWADWNDGSSGETWHAWDQNPLNAANGGPAASPGELFQPGSAGQRAWIGWLGRVVNRWKGRANIVAWEVFSELDLVTWPGDRATPAFSAAAVAFFEAAAKRIRATDPERRPVTASASGGRWDWPELYQTPAMELVQLHLYGPGAELDSQILDAVATVRGLGLEKPILLGETGVDWRPPDGSTLTTAVEGPIATRHAVWAALVSGAMNGRALWWEDGYAVLQNGDSSVAFVEDYPAVEAPALAVLAGRDLTGMQPLPATFDGVGGVLGAEDEAIGWLRDWSCAAPGWDCATEVAGGQATVEVPGIGLDWQASFYDPATGATVGEPVAVSRADVDAPLVLDLPTYHDGIAFTLGAVIP
jgi:hypothetical protein